MSLLVLAAETFIRYTDGQLRVGVLGSEGIVLPASPKLLALLGRFLTPTDEETLVAECPPGHDPEPVVLVEILKSINVLVYTSDSHAAPARGAVDHDRSALASQYCMAGLADLIYQLAGQLRAFGPFAESRLLERTGTLPCQVLLELLTRLSSLQRMLEPIRQEYVKLQTDRLLTDREATHLKLHIGSGARPLADWVNIDVYPAQLSLDVRWGLPFADASASRVFMSHILEHLYYPQEALSLLKDVRRVLSPAGVLRLIVPDIEKCIRAYVEDDLAFFEARKRFWPWAWNAHTKLEGFLAYAGAGPRPAHFLTDHKFGYDFETLERLLLQAGFGAVERSGFMRSRHDDLRLDENSIVAGAIHDGRHYSLFVEAYP